MSTRGWLAVVLVTLASSSSPVRAQRPEADAAFQRGRALMEKGEIAKACREFETSMQLQPLKGTLYNLARCHEALGTIATAWTEFRELAETDSNTVRADDAARRAKALEPKLTRMRLIVHDRVSGLVVMRDRLDVTELADRVVPVDPGHYTFVASAPGRQSASLDVDLTVPGATVDVVIPPLGTDAAAVPDDPGAEAAEADAYALALTRRPVALPRGVAEVAFNLGLSDSKGYATDPIDTSIAARGGLFGRIEGRLGMGFHLRYAEAPGSRPNSFTHIAAGASYLISPRFTVGVDYVLVQPTGGPVTGSDLRLAVARKLVLTPAVAIEARGGLLYSQRNTPTELALTGLGRVQLAVSRVSFQADLSASLNTSGTLYSNTFGLVFGAAAVLALDPRDDVLTSATFDVFPSASDGKRFVLAWAHRFP